MPHHKEPDLAGCLYEFDVRQVEVWHTSNLAVCHARRVLGADAAQHPSCLRPS